MKTLQFVLDHYDDFKTPIEDRFGKRFAQFLTAEQINQIGFNLLNPEEWKSIEWTKENILKQLAKDVDFGFEKAIDHRGISSSLMASVVIAWNKILEEGLENETEYYSYGIPIFQATAIKYEFPNRSDEYEEED